MGLSLGSLKAPTPVLAPGPWTIIGFSTATVRLRESIAAALGVAPADLDSLSYEDPSLRQRENDQRSEWHERFYAGFEEHVAEAYESLIVELAPSGHVYQRVPTFRVHAPGNVAVGSWHRDRDFGHQAEEVNYWLPVTQAWGTNSVWIEQGESFGAPSVSYGEIVVFDGANLLHGNVPNLTGKTRVSIDFRTLPADLLREDGRKTVSAGREFKLGDYWAGPLP